MNNHNELHGGETEHRPETNPSHAPRHASPGTGRRAAIGVTAFAFLLVAVFTYGHYSRSRQAAALEQTTESNAAEAPTVDVVPAIRSTPTRILTLPGEARPFYETTLFARTTGYLKKWNVDIGDHVQEGQAMALIETPELDDQLRESKAKVDELRAEVKLAQAAADFAKISFARWDTGTPDGVVSQQERDQKKSDLDSALAHVEASKANVALGQAEVDRLQTLEDFKQVVAPFAGIVTERHVDIGDLVSAGSSSNTTSLFKIAQYDRVRVFVDVPQASSRAIHVGMRVKATAPEHPDYPYHGTVDRTAGMIDPSTRMLKVEVLVDNPDLLLLPGTYLQVEFETTREHAPLRIPAAALNMKPDGPEVAVVASDGTVTFHKIQIEQDLGEFIEISNGLSEGDRVALNISRDVREGGHVLARSEPPPPIITASIEPPTRIPMAAIQH